MEQKIDDVVREYESCLGTDNIGKLLEIQGKLAILSCNMAEWIKDKGIMYAQLEHDRKVAYQTIISEREEESVASAEVRAFLMTAKARMTEKRAEQQLKGYRAKLNQVNKVIEHLTMVISQLKREEEQTRFQT